MKKILTVSMLSLLLLLSGCSSKKTTSTATTSTQNNSTAELSDLDPLLQKTGYERKQLTDPALYDYLDNVQQAEAINLPTDQLQEYIQKKIGKVVVLPKSTKYGLEGTIKIASSDTIQVTNFSYNGGCGALTISLVNSAVPSKQIANVKEFSTPVSSVGFDIQIPSNLSLIKFDSVAAYCPLDTSKANQKLVPISIATFTQ